MSEINVAEEKIIYYPLTHPQKGIWYTEKMYPGTSIGNIASTVKIKGHIDYSLLEKAINNCIKKNDGIRLRIVDHNGVTMQFVSNYTERKLEFFDFSHSNGLKDLYKWDEKVTREPFEIENSDLFYFSLVKLNEEEGGFYFKVHHLISDAWTMTIIINQILSYYSSLKNGTEYSEDNISSYVDYITSEQEYDNSIKLQKDREYWQSKFDTIPEIAKLKVDSSNFNSIKAKRKTLLTPVKFTKKIREYCKENKISAFALFMTALAIYVNRISGKEEVVIGTPILNRSNTREKNTVGMFINTAPIRIAINEDLNFKCFSENIARENMGILRHQKYPYSLLLKEIRDKFGIMDNLYDISLSYQNAKLNVKEVQECYTARWHFNGYQTNSLTIHINDREDEGHLIIDYDYQSDLFHAKEIEFLHEHLISLLWHGLDDPYKKSSKLEMISEREKNEILNEFNNTTIEYPTDKTIHELFEEQVEKTPDNIAVVFEDKKLAYRELNENANKLARELRQKGVGPNTIVGLMVRRSIDMMVGILGILKAGGAYLPIDSDYPEERIKYMLEDSNVKVLLTQEELMGKVDSSREIVSINNSYIETLSKSNLENLNNTKDLIYIIYTSGSTGNPKGVMVEHKSVSNLIKGTSSRISYFSKNVLSMTSISFDVFVLESLLPLLNGSKVIITNEEEQKNARSINELIIKNNIDIIHTTPSKLNLIIDDKRSKESFTKLTDLILGGESIPEGLIEHLTNITKAKIFNLYGPTEATVQSTIKEIEVASDINIGKPLPNVKIYILDKNKNIVPIGIPGEIHIGGVGVSRGYLNNSQLTQERFISNPFVQNEIIYSTGDIARWYPAGEIEYLGRLDHQVKIRGLRIELGEIESQLLKSEGVYRALVIAKENEKGRKYLCAYVVCDEVLRVSDLRNKLLKKLPNYMIPSYFMKVDDIPLTPNGKVNLRELPEIEEGIDLETEYSLPTNETEKILCEIFSDTLGVQNVGIDDNFFDLGGDSLTIIQILTQILKYDWKLTTQDFYEYSTIRELANKIVGLTEGSFKEEKIKVDFVETKEQVSCASRGNVNFDNVLVTGATGFLGIHILDYIISNTESNVFCLVREEIKGESEKKLAKLLEYYFGKKHDSILGKRIFIVNGDVIQNDLGLLEVDYKNLGAQVDLIIHCAAVTKHYGDYDLFERVNVFGTAQIINFAARFQTKLCHISTTSVSGSHIVGQPSKQVEFTEKDFYIGQNYSDNVYIKSKFEAENLVIKAINNGLDAAIFRMGNLTGRYSDGHFQYNITENAFHNRIKSIIDLGAIPNGLAEQEIEFTQVDYASRAIVEIAKIMEPKARVFHICNHNRIKMVDLLEIFKSFGINIKIVSDEDFKQYIEEISKDITKQHILFGIVNDVINTKVLDFRTPITVDSSITSSYLESLGFSWAPVNEEYIDKVVGFMRKVSFIS